MNENQQIAKTSNLSFGLNLSNVKGLYAYDDKGKSYLDLTSGIAVNNLGFNHPSVVEAIKKQADIHLHAMVYGEYVESPQIQYAKALLSFLPDQLNTIYYTTSGSEAIEGAMKLAKKSTGRQELISFNGAYHGSSHGTLSLIGDENFSYGYGPMLPNVQRLDYNSHLDLDSITEKTAGVAVEVIQAASGVTAANTGWLNALRKKCDDIGCLLIFDEIQTGFGRTGKLFAFEHYGVVPDVLCLAKAMGGGMPMGGFIANKTLMDVLSHDPPLGHINTFGGNGVVCAAANAFLSAVTQGGIIESVEAKADLFHSHLINHQLIEGITYKGLMMALHFKNKETASKFVELAFDEGIIIIGYLLNDKAVRIAPPLIIDEETIRSSCKQLTGILDDEYNSTHDPTKTF